MTTMLPIASYKPSSGLEIFVVEAREKPLPKVMAFSMNTLPAVLVAVRVGQPALSQTQRFSESARMSPPLAVNLRSPTASTARVA